MNIYIYIYIYILNGRLRLRLRLVARSAEGTRDAAPLGDVTRDAAPSGDRSPLSLRFERFALEARAFAAAAPLARRSRGPLRMM